MIWTIGWLVGLVVLVAIGWRQSVTVRANRHVWGRPVLSEEDFATKYFPAEQRAIAARLRRLLAHYVPVNVGRILPSDRLVEELGLAARFSRGLDIVAFAEDLEAEFHLEFEEADYYELKTLRDAVDWWQGSGAKGHWSPRRRGEHAGGAAKPLLVIRFADCRPWIERLHDKVGAKGTIKAFALDTSPPAAYD